MALLDRLTGLRKRTRQKAARRRTRSKARRNKKQRDKARRRQRIEKGDPEGVVETAVVAKRELQGLGSDVAELASTAVPKSARRSASSASERARREVARRRELAIERARAGLEPADVEEDEVRGMFARAEEFATTGPPLDAPIDPGANTALLAAFAEGYTDRDDGGSTMVDLVMGHGAVDDPELDAEPRDPLEVDDPFGVSVGFGADDEDDEDGWWF